MAPRKNDEAVKLLIVGSIIEDEQENNMLLNLDSLDSENSANFSELS